MDKVRNNNTNNPNSKGKSNIRNISTNDRSDNGIYVFYIIIPCFIKYKNIYDVLFI